MWYDYSEDDIYMDDDGWMDFLENEKITHYWGDWTDEDPYNDEEREEEEEQKKNN